jgi:hypothetical protein
LAGLNYNNFHKERCTLINKLNHDIRFSKILVPMDGSKWSLDAARYAIAVGKKITLT